MRTPCTATARQKRAVTAELRVCARPTACACDSGETKHPPRATPRHVITPLRLLPLSRGENVGLGSVFLFPLLPPGPFPGSNRIETAQCRLRFWSVCVCVCVIRDNSKFGISSRNFKVFDSKSSAKGENSAYREVK